MSASENNYQARAWARLARASARACARDGVAGPDANRELFDALEYAATEGRLDLRELVDAYLAGAPQLDASEAWDAVESYLDRIAGVHALRLETAFAQAQRALPDWRDRLRLRVAAHDLALAAQRMLGGQADRIEQTRLAVVDVLDGAGAAGVSQEQLDEFVRELRVEQCDLVSVIAGAAWVAAQRARGAERLDMTLPGPAWATTEEIAQHRGFQLRFAVGKDAVIDSSLLVGGVVRPLRRVVLAAIFGVVPEVLIDGLITRNELTPGDEPGTSTLTVSGRDLSQAFDLEERNEEYPNQPDFVIATCVIARYARYGVIPKPARTTDFPIQLDRIPRQQETDLAFLRRIAQRNGFVFYVEPLTIGVSTAYLGPENRLSLPQPALSIDMGASTTARDVSFSQDGLAPVGVQGSFVDPFLKLMWPLPQLPSLNVPPLALTPTPAARTVLTRDTAQRNPAQAALAGLATATNTPDAVTAHGSVDNARYGHALKPRRLVGVRGAGFSYDGLYYVRSVTHTIERGSYTQRFELSREGTGSITPAVPA